MENTSFVLYQPYLDYKHFINDCKNKNYDPNLVLHNHHIIPKSMGGDNSKLNLIKLSVDDHIQAHLLFSYCFEENSTEWNINLKSARLLKKKSIVMNNEMKHLIQKSYIGENNPFYGKSHTEEFKKSAAIRTHKQWKDITYETAYGNNAELEKDKRRQGVKKYWNSITEDDKRIRIDKMSNSLKGKKPWNTGKRSKYSVDGIIFNSLGEAMINFGCTYAKKLRANHIVIKIK